MAHSEVRYADNDTSNLPFKVTYIVKKTGVVLTKSFNSPFFVEKFVNKLKHSKTCILVSYPIFN